MDNKEQPTIKMIVEEMIDSQVFDYGEQVDRVELLESLGVYLMPDSEFKNFSPAEIRKQLDAEKLDELNATNVIRTLLLQKGKFFEKSRDVYRVALPTENEAISERIMDAAQRRITKSRLLRKNTPKQYITATPGQDSKLMLMEQHLKRNSRK